MRLIWKSISFSYNLQADDPLNSVGLRVISGKVSQQATSSYTENKVYQLLGNEYNSSQCKPTVPLSTHVESALSLLCEICL